MHKSRQSLQLAGAPFFKSEQGQGFVQQFPDRSLLRIRPDGGFQAQLHHPALPRIGGGNPPYPLPEFIVESNPGVFGDGPVGVLPEHHFPDGGRPRQPFYYFLLIGTGPAQPVVQNHRGPDVRLRPDEAPRALGEAQRRPGNQIVGEGVLARQFQLFHAGPGHRIGGRVERDFLDDQQAERRAGNVHPLPEGTNPQQAGRMMVAHFFRQLRHRPLALRQQGNSQTFQRRAGVVAHFLQPGAGGEQSHGPPARRREQARYFLRFFPAEKLHEAPPGGGQIVGQ